MKQAFENGNVGARSSKEWNVKSVSPRTGYNLGQYRGKTSLVSKETPDGNAAFDSKFIRSNQAPRDAVEHARVWIVELVEQDRAEVETGVVATGTLVHGKRMDGFALP